LADRGCEDHRIEERRRTDDQRREERGREPRDAHQRPGEAEQGDAGSPPKDRPQQVEGQSGRDVLRDLEHAEPPLAEQEGHDPERDAHPRRRPAGLREVGGDEIQRDDHQLLVTREERDPGQDLHEFDRHRHHRQRGDDDGVRRDLLGFLAGGLREAAERRRALLDRGRERRPEPVDQPRARGQQGSEAGPAFRLVVGRLGSVPRARRTSAATRTPAPAATSLSAAEQDEGSFDRLSDGGGEAELSQAGEQLAGSAGLANDERSEDDGQDPQRHLDPEQEPGDVELFIADLDEYVFTLRWEQDEGNDQHREEEPRTTKGRDEAQWVAASRDPDEDGEREESEEDPPAVDRDRRDGEDDQRERANDGPIDDRAASAMSVGVTRVIARHRDQKPFDATRGPWACPMLPGRPGLNLWVIRV
jgi:hypothetical protein